MKTKFFFFLAMLLMSSVGAFAQSETNTSLEGDLNHDGEVDAADVVVLVDIIMKKNVDSNKYYWYAGTTLPTASNISSIATGSETSNPNWTADNQQDCTVTNNTGEAAYMYYCFPADWNVEFYDENGFNVGLAFVSNFTYNGIEYKVERLGRKKAAGVILPVWARCGNNSQDPEPTYYWYAGTTLPDASNINTIGTSETSKPNWTADNPQSLAVTNNTGVSAFIYYCFPTTWNVTIYDEDKTSEMLLVTDGTFTYNNVEYTILRQGRQTPNGGSKDFWARCENDIFYWYIGVDNPSYISNIQTDNTKPGWHEIGTSLSGFNYHFDDTDKIVVLSTTIDKYSYYIVIPTGLRMTDVFESNLETNGTYESVQCNISGYKAYKYNSTTRKVQGLILKQ